LKHQTCNCVGVYILAAQESLPTSKTVGLPGVTVGCATVIATVAKNKKNFFISLLSFSHFTK
jgi:hypothetical protein